MEILPCTLRTPQVTVLAISWRCPVRTCQALCIPRGIVRRPFSHNQEKLPSTSWHCRVLLLLPYDGCAACCCPTMVVLLAAALRWLCRLLLPYDGCAACCCRTMVVPLAATVRWLCCLLLPYDGRAACCCPTTVVPLAAAPRSSLARPPITFYCITAESVQGKSGLRSVWSRGHLILARVLGLGVPQRQKASRRSVSAHPSSAR